MTAPSCLIFCPKFFKHLFSIAIPLFFLVIWAVPLVFSENLYIPHLESSENTWTGITICNPSQDIASLKFTAYDNNGAQLSGSAINNPATVSLGPSEQMSKVATEILGSGIAGKSGWVEIESTNPAVKGYFQSGTSRSTTMDGAEISSDLSAHLIFPVIYGTTSGFAGSTTIINLLNPNSGTANVTILLVREDGQQTHAVQVTIGPKSRFAKRVSELFSDFEPISSYYVSVDSSIGLLGYERFDAGQDFAMLLAKDSRSIGRSIFFPHFLASANWNTNLLLVNPFQVDQSLSVTYFQDDGRSDSMLISIPAQGLQIVDVKSIASGAQGNGYLSLYVTPAQENSDAPAGILAWVFYAKTDGSLAIAPQQVPSTQLLFPHVSQMPFTSIVLLNPGTQQSTATLQWMSPGGQVLDSLPLSIPPGKRVAKLFGKLYANLQGHSDGYLKLSSSIPLYGYEFFGPYDSSFYAIFPAYDIFAPPALLTPDPASIIQDPMTHSLLVIDQIIVRFKPDTPQNIIEDVVNKYSCKIIGYSGNSLLYEIRIPSADIQQLDYTLSQFRTETSVDFAVRYELLQAESYDEASPPIDNPNLTSNNNLRYASMDLLNAWKLTTGNHNINIAVIDDGFDITHEDLKHNFGSLDAPPSAVPMEHGTHIAGLIGAEANNKLGIEGIMWDANMMLFDCGLKIFDSVAMNPLCLADMMQEAVNKGAKIINISWGASAWTGIGYLFSNALSQLRNKGRLDALYTIAAGNDNQPYENTTPANLTLTFKDNVIAVGNEWVDDNGTHKRCDDPGVPSNYGPELLYAPGTLLYSAVPSNYSCFDQKTPYCMRSGTSMAAPVLAGVAGLMLSVNPELKASEVKKILWDHAKDTGEADPNGKYAIHKFINAHDAVQRAKELACATGKGEIKGTILDFNTHMPIDSAVVTFLDLSPSRSALTDSQGVFNITQIPSGFYSVEVKKDGYLTYIDNILINPCMVTKVSWDLNEDSKPIDLIVSSLLISPAQPTTQDKITFTGLVSKQNSISSKGFNWRISVDGIEAGSKRMVISNDQMQVLSYASPLAWGKHVVKFEVDTSSEIQEANENNNSLTMSFYVSGVQLQTEVRGSGKIASSPMGVNCSSGICVNTFNYGTTVSLTAAPATGWSLSSWSGNCFGSSATCTLTMTAGRSVTATFAQLQTIQVSVNPKNATLYTGQTQQFTASVTGTTNAAVTWTATCGSVNSSGSYTAPGNSGTCRLRATSVADNSKYDEATVTINAHAPVQIQTEVIGSGTVTSSPLGVNCSSGICVNTFDYGTIVTLTAKPATGWSFSSWSGNCFGSTATCTLTMTAGRSVTATFAQLQNPFKIAFTSNAGQADGRTQLWKINSDGTEMLQLTNFGPPWNVIDPIFSHDGSWIIFTKEDAPGKGRSELWKIRPDGSELSLVNDPGPQYAGHSRPLKWSHHDEQLLFSSEQNNHNGWFELWRTTANGSNSVDCSPNEGNAPVAVFSPDDTKIAYTMSWDYNLPSGLIIMNSDLSNKHTILNSNHWPTSFGPFRAIVWTANDDIIFSSGPYSGGYDIYKIRSDGTGLTPLVTSAGDDSFGGFWWGKGEDQCVSSDGSILVYYSNQAGNYDIYTVNTQNQTIRQLTFDFADDKFAVFSPDGSQIVWISNRAGMPSIWLMNRDGSQQHNLASFNGSVYDLTVSK